MKTLGKVSANLIAKLYDENKTIFTINEIIRISNKSKTVAKKLVFDMLKRKLAFRLKRGKYLLIPQELGSTEKFIGNWYVGVKEIVNAPNYYIGFYSAMKYWGMTTQPVIKIYIATPKRQFIPKTMIDKIHFIYVDKKNVWGIKEEWVTKIEKARISDIEKTIVDALYHPEYCGGITEIAKGIWLIKDRINLSCLLRYIKKYNKNVVAKRLGYIFEILGIKDNNLIDKMGKFVKDRYDLFDPTLEKKVINKNNWRLIDNVGKEQILKIISY